MIDYRRLQSLDTDYKSQTSTTKFTTRLQKTTKVGHRLQSFTNRLQKLDIDYKVLLLDYKIY